MSSRPSPSSSEPAQTNIQLGVGVGVASYSSSPTPFNARPASSALSVPACPNRPYYAPDLFDSSSSSSPPSSSSTNCHSCPNFHLNTNSNLTLTLITTTPLIPIVQQLNTLAPSSAASSASSYQLPCSSSVGSSSAPAARDWFTYEYQLDEIEALIRSHDAHQGFVQSPAFSFGEADKQTCNWRLVFYPNGAGSDCKNFLSIFLKYLSDEPLKIQMMFSIVDNNNDDVYVKYTVNRFQKSNDWGFKQLIHKNAILHQKQKFLKQNRGLLVRVKMRLDEHKNDYIKKLNENLHYCKLLSDNFSQFYGNSGRCESPEPGTSSQASCSSSAAAACHAALHESNYHDIVLLVRTPEQRTGGESAKRARLDHFVEFKAHKCVLAARSPVFKAMFNYKLKENLTNQVVIEDCRPEVVRAMLNYIYTAYLPDQARLVAFDLYIAAEKYFIESLKIKCREYLVESLSMENCIQMYILAEMYNDSMLRKQSLKFINENIDQVTRNCEWNDFMTNYPHFFTNAFIRICKKDF